MATAVDICNKALAYLGDRATVTSIDPPEGSPQADHCARFYPIALGQILRAYAWTFATIRKEVAKLADKPLGFRNAYAVPSDCAELHSVHDEGGHRLRSYQVMRVGKIMAICTDVPLSWIEYTSTEPDAELLPSDFADALAHLLASKLAGAMITGSSGAQMAEEHLKIYLTLLKDCMQRDAIQSDQMKSYRSDLLGDARIPNDLGVTYGID